MGRSASRPEDELDVPGALRGRALVSYSCCSHRRLATQAADTTRVVQASRPVYPAAAIEAGRASSVRKVIE
jgi:hypothetical protein